MTTTERQDYNWHLAGGEQVGTPYEKAVTGFKNYWYPVCGGKEVGRLPKRVIVCGEPIALVRRGINVYAVQDECPHRGARLSLGKDEFPGTDTIACRFHGWTYDLRDGKCVAALTDGPDSPVVGKVRVRTFPVEVRKDIVWIWMGRMSAVPLEEDVPGLILRDDALVRYRYGQVKGNWRYHAEGACGGHFQMLHRDAIALWRYRFFAAVSGLNFPQDDEGCDGQYLMERSAGLEWQGDYPGLGTWPPKRFWRTHIQTFQPAQGVATTCSMRLPGLLRVANWPMNGAHHYEWYVAIDEDHYNYFQLFVAWPGNPVSRIYRDLWYRLWAGPMLDGRFNNQDKSVVWAQTEYGQRHGGNRPTTLYRPDGYARAWIDMSNAEARGEVPASMR